MSSLLDRALADLAEHPDSTAREIAQRIGANDRAVFAVLDQAAYDGRCQRWHPGGSGGAWRWDIPQPPAAPEPAPSTLEGGAGDA